MVFKKFFQAKKVFKKFFSSDLYFRKLKKRSLQIFRKVSGVFQRNFNGLKIVLSSSRGQGNFRGLEASRPSLRTSKCVLEDSTSANGKWFYDPYTTRGVSFNGMMPHACQNPLERQTSTGEKKFKTELIRSVKKMLRNSDTEEDLKNGYHLADILTTTCFIFGNKDISEEFLQGVDEILYRQKDKKQAVLGFYKQVKEDLCSFDMVKSLNSFWWQKSKFNLKHVMYRSTTLFLAIIAKCCNVEGGSSFELIEQLAKMSLITTAEKLKLEHAIAVACEVRLKVYMGKKTQDDWMEQQAESQGKAVGSFIGLIG